VNLKKLINQKEKLVSIIKEIKNGLVVMEIKKIVHVKLYE
jgi:hypothetical protein